jgi:ABC-type polysaccharide/polyol phosphate export permease
LIEVLRAPLYAGTAPASGVLAAAVVASGSTLIAGWLLFTRLDRRFHLYL